MRICGNCKYSETRAGALVCMGQKGMPHVSPNDSCASWKTMKQTNADVVSVVRCKDCKHMEYDALFKECWCWGRRVSPDFYCADGLKKETGEK